MRTTLTLDDDLARKLTELCERRRVSFKQIVNEVIRRGLSLALPTGRRRKPFEVKLFRSDFVSGVDPEKLNQLSDELEAMHSVDRGQ
jgi:hypothetical protein